MKKSAIPMYGAAAAWAAYCLLAPTYKLWHFLPAAAVACLVYFALSRIFKGKTEMVHEPDPPVRTGDEAVDALLRDGEAAVARMRGICGAVSEPGIRTKIAEIADVTSKIFKDVADDPSDYAQIRRFADVFVPETEKLLASYVKLIAANAGGAQTEQVRRSVEDVLDTILASYGRLFDALFKNQIMDIETDIKVLEGMLKREGLSESDFKY
ncbi:MAG: 5-bromo-4-chloroindolyl phosphate hydrolysis family protein [Oscillospiraceae bacterium]|nr:5-bromo-4-chloroindolyl phosphate hydrolysis family protein [Oscillospiraceae bacterium]